MAQSDSAPISQHQQRWQGRRVGITGARGALGQALARRFRSRGAHVVGLTHGEPPSQPEQEWVRWQCGQEEALLPVLRDLDVLVLNHGINPGGDQSKASLNRSLEINALSSWRLLELFAEVVQQRAGARRLAEVWVNTSEAEIQPALSPLYELSKRLLGNLVSLRALDLGGSQGPLRIRRLVLGPFRSALNPIGLMGADFVAGQVLAQARLGCNLIIVSPNPLTYVLMPLSTLSRWLYCRLLTRAEG